MQKVLQWSTYVRILASIALVQPQAAYAALTKSLQSEWLFSLRVISHCGPLFADLENSLSLCFFAIFFWCGGGRGVFNLVIMSNNCYN